MTSLGSISLADVSISGTLLIRGQRTCCVCLFVAPAVQAPRILCMSWLSVSVSPFTRCDPLGSSECRQYRSSRQSWASVRGRVWHEWSSGQQACGAAMVYHQRCLQDIHIAAQAVCQVQPTLCPVHPVRRWHLQLRRSLRGVLLPRRCLPRPRVHQQLWHW